MTLEKRISAWWNSLLCLLLGHTLTTVCTRCGKLVNLEGKKKQTLEERINSWWKNRNKSIQPEYKGSVKLKTGLKKYSINMKTNELRLVDYLVEQDIDGKVTNRKAKYDPLLVYIDAVNDENAIRKANNYLFGVKPGVTIKNVTKTSEEVLESIINSN